MYLISEIFNISLYFCFSENKEVFGRERLGLKLPQILQRQQEVMEFQAAAKRRITKHDEVGERK